MIERYAKPKKIILTVIMLFLGIANIFPFIFMLSSSFKPLNQIFIYPIKLIPETFINRKLVEKIYDNSREVMSRFIARINYAAMEYELAYSGHTFQDSEIMNIASALSQKWYNKNLSILDAKERTKMIKILKIKYKANAYQISRVLGFERKMVEETLGGL